MILQAETKIKIKEYLKKSTLASIDSFDDETLIFEAGLLDSMGLLFLIEFIKEEFGVETIDNELLIENFESINKIAAFIESKL